VEPIRSAEPGIGGIGVKVRSTITPMRTVAQVIVGYAIGRVAIVVVLLVVGLLLVGAHAEHTPTPAEQAIEQQHREQVLLQGYKEEQRQASYAATPGPPYPTKDWTPGG
jgi:hypothetical protein